MKPWEVIDIVKKAHKERLRSNHDLNNLINRYYKHEEKIKEHPKSAEITDAINNLETYKRSSQEFIRLTEYTNSLFKEDINWRWFEMGEIDKALDIFPEGKRDQVFIADKAERLPFPYTVISALITADTELQSYNKESKPIHKDYIGMTFTMFCKELDKDVGTFEINTVCSWPDHKTPLIIKDMVVKDLGSKLWRISYDCDERYKGQKEAAGKDVENDLTCSAQIVLTLLKVLRCKNIRIKKNPKIEALSKKAVKNNRTGHFDCHVLEIEPTDEAEAVQYALGEPTGKHQRLHFRRGHIRRLASGATTWVRNYWAGRAELGESEKVYSVGV